MKFQIIFILILTIFGIESIAQDNRTLDTKVADILAQMPAKNIEHRDNVMSQIISLGDEGFQKISELLTPPGKNDDTAVRFALNSLARYVSQFGKEKERAFVEINLLQSLEKTTNPEIQTFILNQLNLAGGQASVEKLGKYLSNKDLVEPATQTLLAIGCSEAAELLLAALPKADNKSKTTIIRALGELKYAAAVEQITEFTHSDDKNLRKVSLATLAKIGATDSYKTLFNAAKNAGFAYEETNATEAFLHYADCLGRQEEIELMKKACQAIFKACNKPELLHNYSAALRIYTKYLDYEASPLLLDAVENPDRAFRYSVLNLAENIGGIADTRKWIAKAEKAKPAIKADIIAMLGRRACDLANDFVRKNLESGAENVRKEAIFALAKLQGQNAVPVLANHLSKGKDIKASKTVLLQILDNAHLFLIENHFQNSSGVIKAAFIEIIAAKAGKKYFNQIFQLTKQKNKTEKEAAFLALKDVSAYDNVDKLIALLEHVSSEKEISETQMALVSAIQGIEKEQGESGKIFTAVKTSEKKERFLPILPSISGDVALKTATQYFEDSDEKIKNAAFEALANWKNYAASKELYKICQTTTGTFREKAAINFARMVNSTALPDDQKLLQFRKIMKYANTTDKNYIIGSIGRLRTFLSLIYLEQFLNKKDHQQTAAVAIKDIALQGNFYGVKVKDILQKASSLMQGGDSEYYKIDIENYLANMPKDMGFVSMFNGRNLDGWHGMIAGGNPIKIAGMGESERAKAQEEANKKMLENWSVKDGKIVFSGKGHNLVSSKIYKDFEMIVDWLITKEGDSGIYLRGTPQVQIWDTSRTEVGARVGSGGLYNNNKDNVRNPLKVADNPVNEWNTFRITMIGENVTVYLNGELVVENVRMDNYWDRSIPIFESGTIELQAHGNELAFRDVYVREINAKQIGLTQEEIDNGFTSLFNGKNLDGWQGNKTDYYVENGELIVNPKMGGHGNLFTDKEYSDFIFRFEFKLTPGANNGLGLRAPLKGDAAYVGMESQILDNTAAIYANLQDYQYHGSIYGIIPARRGFLNPVGEWNAEEVYLKGDDVKIILNGRVILEGNLQKASANGTLDHRNHPGLKRKKGFIGFLGHGSELKFRNIRIKELNK